jgi:hypothetical protein
VYAITVKFGLDTNVTVMAYTHQESVERFVIQIIGISEVSRTGSQNMHEKRLERSGRGISSIFTVIRGWERHEESC